MSRDISSTWTTTSQSASDQQHPFFNLIKIPKNQNVRFNRSNRSGEMKKMTPGRAPIIGRAMIDRLTSRVMAWLCQTVVSFEPSPQKVLVAPFDGYSFCRNASIAYPPSAVCTTFFTSLNVVLGSTRSRMSVP